MPQLGLPPFHFPNPGRGSGAEPPADGRPGVSSRDTFDAIWWQLFVGRRTRYVCNFAIKIETICQLQCPHDCTAVLPLLSNEHAWKSGTFGPAGTRNHTAQIRDIPGNPGRVASLASAAVVAVVARRWSSGWWAAPGASWSLATRSSSRRPTPTSSTCATRPTSASRTGAPGRSARTGAVATARPAAPTAASSCAAGADSTLAGAALSSAASAASTGAATSSARSAGASSTNTSADDHPPSPVRPTPKHERSQTHSRITLSVILTNFHISFSDRLINTTHV